MEYTERAQSDFMVSKLWLSWMNSYTNQLVLKEPDGYSTKWKLPVFLWVVNGYPIFVTHLEKLAQAADDGIPHDQQVAPLFCQ